MPYQHVRAWSVQHTDAATDATHEYEPSSTDELIRCHCYQEPDGTWFYVGRIDGESGDASGYQVRGEATLSPPRPTLLRKAKASDFYDALVSAQFAPPTALCEGGTWRPLMHSAGKSVAEQHKEMKHVLACTKSPWLSRRQQQTLYMVATNAVPIGYRIGQNGAHDQLEHVILHSPVAVALWQRILPLWASLTPAQGWTALLLNSGVADAAGRRAIALGVRPDGETANEEQWHALRAIAIDALLTQYRANTTRIASGHPPLTATQAADAAYSECRAELQKIVTLSHRVAHARTQFNLSRPHRIKSSNAERAVDAWYDAWIASGLAANVAKPQQGMLPPPNGLQTPRPKAMPPPQVPPADMLVIYTDGSGPDQGAANATTAGWGFTAVTGGNGDDDDQATEVHSRCGPVITEASSAAYIGAERATNNTAELTAIARALKYVIADQSGRPVLIRYDSLYAGNIVTGKWRARKNRDLAERIRALWTKAHDHLRGRLWASHVYGHAGHKWNERADELARRGKGGAPAGTHGGGNSDDDDNDHG